MKYLVNRETKYHKVLGPGMGWHPDHYDVVQADAEGWIERAQSDECPLPDDQPCEGKTPIGTTVKFKAAKHCLNWFAAKYYRPILDKPEAEAMLEQPECKWPKCRCEKADCIEPPEPTVKESLTVDIISRLKSAHEAAQSIPDLLAELREALGPELLRMLTEKPLDAELDIVPPSEWQKGDLIICTNNFDAESALVKGQLYEVYGADPIESCVLITKDKSPNATLYNYNMRRFRFHSRPGKTK